MNRLNKIEWRSDKPMYRYICKGRPMCLPKEPSFGEKEWVG